MAEEMATRKTNTFRDPSKTMNPKEFAWSQVGQAPTRHITGVIRPKILAMDIEGCERILSKVNNDKEYEDLES